MHKPPTFLAIVAITISSLTISTASTSANGYTWAESYGAGSYDFNGNPSGDAFYWSGIDFPVETAPMPDGGLVVAGQLGFPDLTPTGSNGVGPLSDATLVRFAPDGSMVWQKELKESTALDSSNQPRQPINRIYEMRTDSNGNIFVLGATGNIFNGNQPPYVAKFMPDGALVWENRVTAASTTFGNPAQTYPLGLGISHHMCLTNDGGVLISSTEGRPDQVYTVPILIKFNSDGSLGMYAAFEHPNQYSDSFPVAQSGDGTKYVLLAQYPANPNGGEGVTAIVTDTNGAIIAEKSLPADDNRTETPRAIIATADGGFAALSWLNLGTTPADALVVRKFNSDLSQEIFEKVIKCSARFASFSASSLRETSDGSLLIGGNVSAQGEGTGGGGTEAALMKLKTDGTLEFVSLLGGANNEMYNDGLTLGCDAIPMPGGGYAFTIATYSYAVDIDARKSDWWIVRTDGNRQVANFGGLMIDQSLDRYTVTDTTRTPTDITAFTPVSYSVATQTDFTRTFSVLDVGSYTEINHPTNSFQATATPIGGPASGTITFSATGPFAAAGPIHFFAMTAAGRNVRVQTSTIPDDEISWTDLDDGNGGAMTEDANNPGSYVLDSVAYPSGGAIYFRAIATKPDESDLISAPLGPFSLQQATMSIFASITSTSDPINGQFAHIGDDVVYTLRFSNTGSATAKNLRVITTVPTYIESQTNLRKQFVASDVMMSPGSTFIPESSADANDAQIVWDAGDLDAGLQNFVRFTIHISNKVRTEQQLGIANDYAVFSTTNEPAGRVTGYTSGAVDPETNVEGPISLSVVANGSHVAPGAQFSYTLTLKNLGSTTVNHAVAIMAQPEFTRFIGAIFSNTPLPPKKKPKKGTPPPFNPTAKLAFVQGQSEPEVVMDVGPLTANQTVTITLTFLAAWADPTEVPKLSTIDYSAAFLTEAAYATFLTNYASASSDQYNPGVMDFFSFIGDISNNIALSHNDSGIVDLPMQGSLENQPLLSVAKEISNTSSKIATDGNGQLVNGVKPGDQISFILTATNFGKSQADNVYLQDRMPDHTRFVSAALVKAADLEPPPPTLPTRKKKAPPLPPAPQVGALRVVADSDGHHLRFAGFSLPPHVGFVMTYTVQLDSGVSAPPDGTLINADGVEGASVSSIGSSSSPHTPQGIYNGGAIQVTGEVQFAQPLVRAFVPRPGLSYDIGASANALTAIYNSHPNAAPQPDSLGNYFFGGQYYDAQRYYVHFENSGNVTATGVTLDVPLPPHTAFYRAAFVTLPSNRANGQPGYMPGIINNSAPGGWGINAPAFLSTNTTVTFTMNQLPAATSGDVMVEVIPTADALNDNGSLIGGPIAPLVTIRDSNAPVSSTVFRANIEAMTAGLPLPYFGWFGTPHQAQAVLTITPLADEQHVPKVGIMKMAPREVLPNEVFTVQVVVYNYGDRAASALCRFWPPENTQVISAAAGESTVYTGIDGDVTWRCATNNGPSTDDVGIYGEDLLPQSAGALTVTLRATGAAGSVIRDVQHGRDPLGTPVFVHFMGNAVAAPMEIPIVAANSLVSPTVGTQTNFTSVPLNHFMFNGGDVFLLELGGGKIVASGGGNIVASGGGNIVASGGGNIVASGGGNLIPIGTTDAATLLANKSQIVASGGGNIVVPQGASIVASGGGNIVASGGGNIVASGGGNIVASGGGNIVASGGGNIIPASIASFFGTGTGQIVASGGGNIVASGGGNIVASGGGNIVASGGGNIVASGGGNVVGSLGDSKATLTLRGGNIVASGGGNIVASGGGN